MKNRLPNCAASTPGFRISRRAPIYTALAATFLLLSAGQALFAQGMGRGQPPGGPGGPQAEPASPIDPRNLGTQLGPRGTRNVVEIRIEGNRKVHEAKIRSYLKTREGRVFDPDVLESDTKALYSLFSHVSAFIRDVPGGVVVTLQVYERPTVEYVKYVGNRSLRDSALEKRTGLRPGQPLDAYIVEDGRRKLEEYYVSQGFARAQVTIVEGVRLHDRGVVYKIEEGPLQRIWSVDFIGNSGDVATNARLTTQIQQKPGLLWPTFATPADPEKIREDEERLTGYYRSLGYFGARVGHEKQTSEDGAWLYLTFVIDEGPQYHVRNISVLGNQKYEGEQLLSLLELQSGDAFNLARMNRDVNTLLDLYGGQGHVFADVNAEPRFLEDPGTLDLVYRIQEGEQFRVGRINIHIAGEYPHTRENVLRNRISLRHGDVIDIGELRDSERRLKASQLFLNEPQRGVEPMIVIRPPELQDANSILAEQGLRPHVRY